MFNLFQQNPKSEKFEVDSSIRIIESNDMDRKEDLEKFKNWMQGISTEKSDLPSKGELDKLHDEATKARGTSFGILGIVAAIGAGGLGFHFLGGFGGISKMLSDAMSFLTGGGIKPSTGAGDDILGLKGSAVESLTPVMPDLSGPSTALSGQTSLPEVSKVPTVPTVGTSSQTQTPSQPKTSGQSSNPNSSSTAQPKSAVIDQSSLPPLPPTGTGQYASAQQYGAPRDDDGDGIPDRKHAGQDFDAGPNGTFYSRIGGEVIYAANAGGAYGNVVDVYNSQLGVTERVAEGDNNLVSAGDVIQAGTPVQRGTAQTGVFHYEIRKGKADDSGSFAGTLDPLKFLNNLPADALQQVEPNAEIPTAPDPINTSQQPNMFDGIVQSLTNLISPYTSQIGQVFEAIEYVQDKERMDNTILYRDVITGDVKLPTQNTSVSYDIDSIIDTLPPEVKISMLSPDAEAYNNGMIIINSTVPGSGGGGSPGGISGSSEGMNPGTAPPTVIILGGSNIHNLHKKQMYRKLGAK